MWNRLKSNKRKAQNTSKSLANIRTDFRKGIITKNQANIRARSNMNRYGIKIGTPFYQPYINFINRGLTHNAKNKQTNNLVEKINIKRRLNKLRGVNTRSQSQKNVDSIMGQYALPSPASVVH